MYQNPIEMVVRNVSEQVAEDFNNQLKQSIMYTVNKEYHINVDEKELIKALQYDRQQYNQGYDDGCHDGYVKALSDIKTHIEDAVRIAVKQDSEYNRDSDFHCDMLAENISFQLVKAVSQDNIEM